MNFMMKFILLVLQVCAAIASSQVLQNSSGTPPKEMMQSTPPLSQKAPSILTAPPSMSEVPSIHEVPPSMLKVPPPFMAEAPPSVPQAPPPSVPQAPPSMPQAAPSMSEIPPLSIPQISPSMSEQPPPSMTQTSPPSMSEAPPPSMAQAPPPSMSQAPPPSMPQAPPPSMPQAPPPPSMPQAPPPSMPQAPPPSMPQAPPPSMSKAPPPSLSEAPPSMSEIPPLSIPQVSPSMSQQPLPSMTQTSPPSMSEAPPPSMAQAPLPSMNQAPPPSMPQAPPPSMPQAPPPSMPQAPPPSMPQAPPAPSMPQAPPAPSMHHAPPAPSMPQAPPPSIPQAPPPSMPQAPPPSMSEAPPPSLSEATPSTSKQLPPATPQQPPPATPQQPPPSMPQAPPPLMPQTPPPSMSEAPPPSMAQAPPPSMFEAPPSTSQQLPPATPQQPPPSMPHAPPPLMPQTPPPSMSEAPPPSMPQVPPSMAQAPPPSMFEAPPSMPQAPPPSMFQAPPPSIPKIPPSVSEIPPSISQRPPPFVPQVPPSMFEAPPPSIPQIPPSMSEAPTSMSQQPRPSIPQVPPSMSEAPPSISQRPPSSLPHVPPPSLSEAPPTSMPQVPSSMSKAPPPFMLLVPPPSMSKAPPPAISEAPPPSLSETTPSMPQAPPPSMSKAPPSIPDVPPSTSHVAPPPSMPQAPPSMAQRPPSFMPGPVASPPNKSLINPPPIFPILDAPSPSNLPAPSAPEAPPPTRYHPPMSLSPSYPSPPQGPKRKPTHYASPPPNRTNITSNNHSPLKAPYVHIAPSSNNYAPPPDSSSESPPPTKSRPMPFSSPSYPPPPPGPKSKPEHYAPPPQYRGYATPPFDTSMSPATSPVPSIEAKMPFLSPGVSRPQTSQRMPKISIQALPPPPPNEDCSSVTCNEPLTTTPPGTPCKCVMPMQIELALGVAVYTFFPLVSELAFEIAFGVSMKSSQVRIMAANADDQDSEKTIVIIDLVPLGQTFDQFTAYMTAQRFWLKQVPIKSSLFGDYEVLYVKYPGLPPSPPLPSSSIGTNGQRHGNGGKTIKPLGVDVSNQSHNKKLNGGIIAIIVLSASVASILFCVIIWVLFFKRKNGSHSESTPPATLTSLTKSSGNAESTTGSRPVSDSLSFDQSTIPYTGSLKLFTVSEMEKATNNFEESGVLGEGGFGRVYNGILEDNTKVAVKVLTRVGRQGGREFLAEVEMLSRLHHRNLVRLIGICTEENKRCLVYELIPNGSVESHLHGTEKETGPLDWAARLKIALGAARGLAYLHEDSSPRVIHRDFKSSNILLEHDFTPKVSDFGLARTGLDEQNGHISTRVMGTFGYVAPEYAMTGHLLVKSDVYSYGVVLLELLTGRKPVDMSMPSGQENLVAWARPLLPTPEGLNLLIDPSLCTETPFESISKVAAIASMCVQPEVSHRPFMGEVVQALKLVCDECEEEPRDLGSITSPDARASSYSGPAWPERSNESTLDIETGLDSGSYRISSSSGPLSVGRRRLEGDVLRLFSRSR